MRVTYQWRFQVRTYETDQQARVQDGFYINYLQEAATLGSAAAGFPMQWYLENKMLWLIKRLTIRYFQPAYYLDDLEITTWISDLKRVQSHREYDMRRVSDGAQIVRGRVNWAFVNLDTMQLQRVPDGFKTLFGDHHEPLEDLSVPLSDIQPIENAPIFVNERTAESHEIDMAGHVNNGVYPRWIEQSMKRALTQLGMFQTQITYAGRELEYFRAAVEGDRVRVTSRITGFNDQYVCWQHEVAHAESGDLMVRDQSVMVVDQQLVAALS